MSDIEIQQLYAASYRRLLGQFIGVTGSVAEAEDVLQEAFVRGLDHPRRLLGADNPEAWLRTVAVNLARSRLRRAQRFLGLARGSSRTSPRAATPKATWRSSTPCGSFRPDNARSSRCTTWPTCPWSRSPTCSGCPPGR